MGFFKFSLMGCLIFLLGAADNSDPMEIPKIREVSIDAEHVFIPNGFDSNDNSEIVASGWFPNPCYEWSRSIITKGDGTVGIELKALIKKGSNTTCIAMAVPFMEAIKIGPVSEGDIKIHVGTKRETMKVTKANSSSIDDYIYGQVKHISSDNKHLTIEMAKPSSCITFDHFKVIYNGQDTCAVLPIMKQISWTCPRDPSIFKKDLFIPDECLSKAEKVLFHVRSLAGKSVNYLYDNAPIQTLNVP